MKAIAKANIALEKYEPKEVFDLKGKIRVTRKDGFIVFLDKVNKNDPDAKLLLMLNKIRLTKKPDEVIMAVGLVRGVQIARNYANSYARKDTDSIIRNLKGFIQGITYEKENYKKNLA